jgi:DNA repair protein RadC
MSESKPLPEPKSQQHRFKRDFPDQIPPREKLQQNGAVSLSDDELLAILLRVGISGESVLELSRRLLHEYGGLTGLSRVPFDELCQVRGLGEAKASQLKAALEMGRRLLVANPETRSTVRSPNDIVGMLMLEMNQLEQEVLKVVLLNTKNQIIRIIDVYRGTLMSSNVRVAELFREAIRQNATSIIMVHNHPSGDPTPSADDVRVTGDVQKAGKLMDIELLDHLVIGHQRFISMREKGLGFNE